VREKLKSTHRFKAKTMGAAKNRKNHRFKLSLLKRDGFQCQCILISRDIE
jgi:hypothetical protein